MTNPKAPSALRINDEYVLTNRGIQQAPSADRYEQYKQNPFYPFESEKQWLDYDNQLIDRVREKDKAPSATDIPQPTAEERNHFAEHNNSRIINYTEAPSATDIPTAEEWKQMQKEYDERCQEVSALSCELEQLKAPSATVDKKDAFLDTTVRVAEEQLRSEQATVDEIELQRLLIERLQYSLNNVSDFITWSYSEKLLLLKALKQLRSQQENRYTREEVIDVGVKIVGGERFRPFVIATLDQFDKEGK